MERARVAWLAAAAALAPLLSGCLGPYASHVDPDALGRTALPWVRSDPGSTSSGLLGTRTVEVDYTHDPEGTGPPFAGVLQVFSVREPARRSNGELLGIAEQAVQNATQAQGIRLDPAHSQSGARTLAGGLATRFFVREGTATSSGLLFPQDARVRIIGEAGYDGRSSTMVVVVGLAQVEARTQCPIIECQPQGDPRTWIEMVGDRHGSVGGAASTNGLIDHLVTHG